ncbi:phage tail protein [Aureimonas pseudogalii]|uniref:Phage tail collar domain-containing protein n=1 Tax=Aureimonas pseudogalii TaxID=1744844 RepID=A0A7W6MM04_9HYPH|nr:phage tail protein [Aureimonas pseudogalii]MBB4000304.1 hypothetical protein [Aureimonas pseudogalii]
MSFVGMITAFAGNGYSKPAGWLVCDGELVEKEKYSELYAVIGDAYGRSSDGHKFYIPDFQGMFLRGLEKEGGARDPDGDARFDARDRTVVGRRIGSVQLDAFQAHAHKYWMFPGQDGGIASGQNWKQKESITHEFSDGARTSAETRPKNVYVNYLICYRTK